MKSLYSCIFKGLMVASALFFFMACGKDITEPEGINVSPDDLVYAAQAGHIEIFKVRGYAAKKFIRLRITSKRPDSYTETLLDSSFGSRERFSIDWEYRYENDIKNYTILLNFILTDETGTDYSAAREVHVRITDVFLTEFSGRVVYSSWSGQANALDIATVGARHSWLAPRSAQSLMDDSTGITTDSLLSRAWISPAGGSFLKFNGFDYAQATENKLKATLSSGALEDRVDNIQPGDIILYRHKSQANSDAAIRVLNVFDLPGTAHDRYELAIKKLP